MSSELKSTSRARPRPMTRGSRAIGPPPATRPTPTSHCEKSAFSRLAELLSQARARPLPLPGPRSAGEAHVAGERELTAVAGRSPPDQRDRNERGARQAHQDVGPCLEAGRTLRDAGQILEVREEVGVIQKEAVDRTFEDHHLHSVVVLERRHDLSDLRNKFRTHEVERRIVEYDSTV